MTFEAPDGRLLPVQHEAGALRSKIVNSLREAIEIGVLKPGMRLVEKDLQEQLQVSRTSLREALRELKAEGILADFSGRGLAVRDISAQDAASIYSIRSALESLVIEQFIKQATDSDMAALREKAEHLKSEYRSGDAGTVVLAKRAFFSLMCTVAGNTIALDVLNRLTPLTSSMRRSSIMRPGRRHQSIADIEAIVEAVVRRDVVAARQALENHLAGSQRSALGEH